MNERLLINIAGGARAGKSTACRHLAEKYGFSIVRVSDIIREFALNEGLALGPRRDYLSAHWQMKQKLGADVVARTILAEPSSRLCVDGLRVPNDQDRLRQEPGILFRTMALVCPLDLSYARSKRENSLLDQGTYTDFLEEDIEDGYNPDPEKQNTDAVIITADYHVDSSRPEQKVLASIDRIVESILENH